MITTDKVQKDLKTPCVDNGIIWLNNFLVACFIEYTV